MKWLLPLALLLVSASEGPQLPPPEAPLDVAAMRRHIEYLASDALEGRAPGSEGGSKAAQYIAGEFVKAGLQSGAGGGWYQPVPLIERTPGEVRATWAQRGQKLALDPTLARYLPGEASLSLDRAPVVFAGFDGNPDAIDVRGKVVLLMSGRPEGVGPLEERRRNFTARGAAAVLALAGENDPWELIRDQLGLARTVAAGDPHAPLEGALAFAAWRRLVPGDLVKTAQRLGFRPRLLPLTLDIRANASVRRYDSVNVIGRLPGRTAPGEALFFLAHWDHLGLCRPPGAVDRICNGAVDNASGIAMLVEVARRLARGPRPPRSIYFIATTGEELGLLGAKALVAAPPVPLDKVAAAFNFDTVAIGPGGEPVATIGRGRTPLDPLIDEASRIQRRPIDDSEAANAFIGRQDGYALLEAGVPAVMIGGAFSDVTRLATFLAGDYHKPSDDLEHPIVLEGAAEDGALHVVLARMLADPDKFKIAR